MAIRNAFDLPPLPGEEFPETRRVTTQEDWTTTPGGGKVFYLSRRIHFKEGDYEFKAYADDSITVWLGDTALTTRLILAAALETGVATVNLHIPEGTYRLDVLLVNLPQQPSPSYFALTIAEGGEPVYVSAKEGWLLDDAPINDDDLPPLEDPRLSLPVFSVLPNWGNGITERLSWLTDVMDSESNSEQRRSIRRHPRRSFEASFLRKGTQRMRIDTFLVGVGMTSFLVPIWHEQVPIIDGLSIDAGGVTFENNDTRLREFNEGDLVFVNNGDPDDYDILKVGTVEVGRFNWSEAPKRVWPPGVRIFPLRIARLLDNAKMDSVTDRVGVSQLRFELSDPDVRIESWGDTINGEPIFKLKIDRRDALQVTYSRRAYVLDNSSGKIAVTDTGRYSTTNMQTRAVLFNRENAYAFRQFLAAARGRARHFFCPSFTHDIEPQNDIAENTINLLIEPMGYWQYMARPQPIRLTMGIMMVDESPTVYRRIETIAPVYKLDADGVVAVPPQIIGEIMTLDESLPEIFLYEIDRISFVSETRFDQDTFELHHVVNGQRAVELSLTFRQAQNPRKGIP